MFNLRVRGVKHHLIKQIFLQNMETGLTAVISISSNKHLFKLTILEKEFYHTLHRVGPRNKYKCRLIIGNNELVFDYFDSVHNYEHGIVVNQERLVSDVLFCIVQDGLYYIQMDESETLTREQWKGLTRTNKFWAKVYGDEAEERLSEVSSNIETGNFVWNDKQ